MEASTAQRQPPPDLTEEAVLAALVVVLLSGLPPAAMAGYAASILAPLGLSGEATAAVLDLLAPHLEHDLTAPPASALGAIARTAPARHAAHVLNAVKRLSRDPQSINAERRYLAQHLDAERIRKLSAQRVDAMAARVGPILGWHAVMDKRTTPECRAAHGRNFSALVPPAIGYPGTLHGGTCRCRPGRPFDSASMLP